MQDGEPTSDVGTASVSRHQVAEIETDNKSPTKSSSASEEEGQFEERDRVEKRPALSSTTPARHASSRETIGQDSNVMSRENSTPASWKQHAPAHSDRKSYQTWRQDASESFHNNVAGRGRGKEFEVVDAESGPSRRAYRMEERGSYNESYSRNRDSLQPHDRYDAATRSVSTGSYDERYQSPSATHYDDRTRDWNRERVRERDYQWERARDPAWTRGQYIRPSSPSRPSPTPHSRGMSGSWSGPTSPSSSWRERWSSGSGPSTNTWDRERRDRDRDRNGYWQSREGIEIGPDVYQRKLSNPRSPPLREARDQSRSRVAKANYNRMLQSNSSPTPSIGRSPDLQRSCTNEIRRESEPRTTRRQPDDDISRQRQSSTELRLARPLTSPSTQIKQEEELKANGHTLATAEAEAEGEEKETPTAKTEDVYDQIEDIPAPIKPLEAINEEEKSTLPEKKPEIITITTRDEQPTSSAGQEILLAQDQSQESGAPEVINEIVDVVNDAVESVKRDEAQQAVEEASKLQQDARFVQVEKGLELQEVTMAEVAKLKEDVRQADDTVEDMTTSEHEEATRTVDDVNMEQDMQYDASGDVTIESVDIGDDTDMSYPPRLQLDQQRLQDFSDDPPLPTPQTREEQDRLKRVGMFRLLKNRQPNLYEIKRVFDDNKKVLAMKSLIPLESAIHGEYPRKNHTEPWLDEDDEEIKLMRLKMTRMMQIRQKKLNDKIISLQNRYKQLNKDWQRHCAQLYRMSEARESQNSRTLFGGTVTISGTSASLMSQGSGLGQGQGGGVNGANGITTEDSNVSLISTMGPSMTRANRRQTQTGFAGFGDAVRSEAEFLEILASLENADMQDPTVRAARTTATEPDMILNPDSTAALLDDYDDDNGFVADPLAFYFPTFDPDHWAEDEKITFERRYALFPKQFGKIAASLPHKTAKQCVSYYYLTKHAGHDYKSLTAARNRDRKRKTRVKPKKGRGSALMADLKGGDDGEEDDQQSPLEGFMTESTSLISPRPRSLNTSSRARILTNNTLSGDLGVVVEEGEDDSFDLPSGRKRRVEEMDSDEKKSRPGNKSKRVKSEKKSRSGTAQASREETPVTSSMNLIHGDPDLAAAEALGALAGAGTSEVTGDNSLTRRKKTSKNSPARTDGVEDGIKRSRQTTSSYWSVAERNEFLRSLATWGKDWDAIASTLSTKSAAQARNYYARNVEEIEFVEAMTLAKDNASLELAKRQDIATAFILRRASMTIEKSQQMGVPHSGYFAPSATSTPDGNTPTARGLNINSLLNEEMSSNTGADRGASLNEWFGKKTKDEEDSNDDTEDDEEQDQVMEGDEDQRQDREPIDYFDGVGRSSRYEQGYHSVAPPSHHHMIQANRRSPSILSSMPPPSAFIGSGRYQLPGQQQRISLGGQEGQRSPLSSFHYVDAMSRANTHSPSDNHPSTQYHRHNNYERDPNRSSWSSAVSTPNESMPVQHRHGSWSHTYSPSHLAPPQSKQSRDDRSSSSLSPYPRPNSTHGTTNLSSHSFTHSNYDRPHSSGHISSVRSLSPNPPTPRLPPLNQSLFSQRREQRDSSQ